MSEQEKKKDEEQKQKGEENEKEDKTDKGKVIDEEQLKIFKGRHCTDIPCCLLFICYFIAMFGIALYGFGEGDPNKLTYPYDMYGFQCGLSGNDAEDYPYLYYPYPYELLDSFDISNYGYNYTTRICLKKCPEDFGSEVSFFSDCDKCLQYPKHYLVPDNDYDD